MSGATGVAQQSGVSQSGALKIVVVEGEAGVNIIQQKTAVKPLIEVRDRNNQPIAGVVVTFSIEGGKAATFGGASSLTVATNAAGQAAVSSLTPNVAGAFQIQVSAAFQGQVATATIAQTNVLTAAQAAAASAASGSGSAGSASGAGGASGGAGGATGGAAGAGGLSTTTIAVAGAAVAGGAVAATEVIKNGEDAKKGDTFTGNTSGTTIETVVSRNSGQVCNLTRNVTAQVTFTARSVDPNNVSGELRLDGTATITSNTCAALSNPTNPVGGTTEISGPASALRGSFTGTNTNNGPNGEVITGTSTSTFEGSMSGSTVTGTLKVDGRSQSTGSGGGPVDSTSSTTFQISLTKS